MSVASESTTLDGLTVGITADRRWEEQAELLRRRGASVLHGPTIRTLPLGPENELRVATHQVIEDPPDIVVANTGIGMRAWFAAAASWGIEEALLGALSEARIVARGPKAAAAAHGIGLPGTERAGSERLDEVLAILVAGDLTGRRVAFQEHGDESPTFVAALRSAGASVVTVPVYRWKVPLDLRPASRLLDAVCARRVQAVTFTSAPAVRHLFALADDEDRVPALLDALNDSVLAACVGEVCADAARELGVWTPLVPTRSRLGPMIRCLVERLALESPTRFVGGLPVVQRGTVVMVDGARFELPDREAAVFSCLLHRPGAVVSKATLARTIWGAGADEHLVEVTVARLRKRLEVIAGSLVTVPRRGYALRTDS